VYEFIYLIVGINNPFDSAMFYAIQVCFKLSPLYFIHFFGPTYLLMCYVVGFIQV